MAALDQSLPVQTEVLGNLPVSGKFSSFRGQYSLTQSLVDENSRPHIAGRPGRPTRPSAGAQKEAITISSGVRFHPLKVPALGGRAYQLGTCAPVFAGLATPASIWPNSRHTRWGKYLPIGLKPAHHNLLTPSTCTPYTSNKSIPPNIETRWLGPTTVNSPPRV